LAKNKQKGASRNFLGLGLTPTNKGTDAVFSGCHARSLPPHIHRRACARDYSGHSLRGGAAQDMAAVGIGMAAILQAGGWKDERMVRRYIRKLGALEGGMAQFVGRGTGQGRGRPDP